MNLAVSMIVEYMADTLKITFFMVILWNNCLLIVFQYCFLSDNYKLGIINHENKCLFSGKATF